jgi:hypothetical protein
LPRCSRARLVGLRQTVASSPNRPPIPVIERGNRLESSLKETRAEPISGESRGPPGPSPCNSQSLESSLLLAAGPGVGGLAIFSAPHVLEARFAGSISSGKRALATNRLGVP